MKKKIYVCPKCGRGLNFSDNPEYTFQCFECDEDFYAFEAKEIEQPRMEGIVDYTDLAKASMEIKAITESTINASNRKIAIKGNTIIEQIAEYISETLKPIFDSGIHKEDKFTDCARIYNGLLRLYFASYHVHGKAYDAQLFCEGKYGCTSLRVYFNTNGEYIVEGVENQTIIAVAKDWAGLKDSMSRMIAYAIKECNKANQKRIEDQEELSKVIDSFRL